MKFAALCTLLSTFFAIALANTGVEHDGIGAPSHLSSESDSNSASNENAAVQLCIFVATVTVRLCIMFVAWTVDMLCYLIILIFTWFFCNFFGDTTSVTHVVYGPYSITVTLTLEVRFDAYNMRSILQFLVM